MWARTEGCVRASRRGGQGGAVEDVGEEEEDASEIKISRIFWI